MQSDIMVICREVNRETGEIAVYPLEKQSVSDYSLLLLNFRSKYNPELRYFAVLRERWETDWQDEVTQVLKRKIVKTRSVVRIGVVEL